MAEDHISHLLECIQASATEIGDNMRRERHEREQQMEVELVLQQDQYDGERDRLHRQHEAARGQLERQHQAALASQRGRLQRQHRAALASQRERLVQQHNADRGRFRLAAPTGEIWAWDAQLVRRP